MESKIIQVNTQLDKRITCNDNNGTIRYSGPLTHEGAPAGSDQQVWLGIEWDDPTRGRHNGTVKNTKYFETSVENAGTLIKEEKVSYGMTLIEGVFKKYFRDNIPEDNKKAILEQLESQIWDDDHKKQQESQPEYEKEKVKEIKNDEEIKADENAGKVKKILVEYDENVYFETFRKQKKMVEFYGFDKIWEKLNNMKELKEISLCGVQIGDLGGIGYFKKLLPTIKVFSIESNLLYDWNQVFQIGNELDTLQELSISNNFFKNLDKSVNEISTIQYVNAGIEIHKSPAGIFQNLEVLNLINTKMNWKLFSLVAPAFPILQELILCRNNMTDTENINFPDGSLKHLKFLNLEKTELTNFEGFKQFFGELPNLDKLILNFNNLTELGKITNFKNVTSVSLEKNQITDPKIFTELSQFEKLSYLNIKKNPVGDIYGKPYVRQRAVAENPNLCVVNGSDLLKYERKDCEIFYLRKIFEDYFKKFDKVYYDYEFNEFLEWATPSNPRLDFLLKKYGNPYEVKPKQENNMESESIAKNVMVRLNIIIAAGPMTAKTLNKRFPDTTNISTLKNIFQNLYKIPADQQIITYKVNPEDEDQKFEEDHKPLNFYGIKDNTEIVLDSKENQKQ